MSSLFFRQAWVIVRNDLRLTLREWRSRRWGAMFQGVVMGVLLVLLAALSVVIFLNVGKAPPLPVQGLIWGLLAFLMFGSAVNQTVVVLCERGDFDLLLSSPVPPRTLLAARLTSIVVAAAIGAVLLAVPLVAGMAVGLHWRYLAGLPTWLTLSVLVATVAISFGLALVKWLGVRRARLTIQIAGALLGASAYLATQAQHFSFVSHPALQNALTTALHWFSLEWVARAARGEMWPLLSLMVGSVAALWLALNILERTFLRGTQDGGEKQTRSRSIRAFRFNTQLTWATVRKDARLILRDPLLLSQLLPSLLYMIPGVFAMTRHPGLNTLAPLCLAVVLQTSAVLAMVAANGEECWDLIRMSPLAEIKLRAGKAIAAALAPCAFVLVIVSILLVRGRPWMAGLTLLTCLLNAGAMAWLNVIRVTPQARQQLLKPQGRRRTTSWVNMVLGFGLAITGGIGLALASYPSPLTRVIGLALVGVNVLIAVTCLVVMEPRAAEFNEAT